jgi:enediyne biosynthesis protein E4
MFVVDGHVYPQVDSLSGEAHFKQPMMLFRNRHDGTFADISAAAGLSAVPLASRRGAAFGDINNDGCVDVVVLNVGETPSLLLNHCQNGNHRVLFNLTGSKSNRLAIGARVTVKSESMVQFQEVRSGGSYISQNDLRLHFGLGKLATMKQVEISWPSGKTEVFHNLPADLIYTVNESQGIQARQPLPPTR